MNKCPHCYSVLENDAQFCSSCGRTIKNYSDARVVTLGRGSDNDIVINNSNVSSHHAVFRIENNRIMLEDLNSSNGTFVNDRKVLIANVSERDRIMFGAGNYFDWKLLQPFLGFGPAQQVYTPQVSYDSPPRLDGKLERQHVPPPAYIPPNRSNQNGLGNELVWAMEMNKSYIGSAVITMLLYLFVIWIGGLIANIVYLNQANRTKAITGQSPPGYGCLLTLLIVLGILPAVVFFLFFSVIMSALG